MHEYQINVHLHTQVFKNIINVVRSLWQVLVIIGILPKVWVHIGDQRHPNITGEWRNEMQDIYNYIHAMYVFNGFMKLLYAFEEDISADVISNYMYNLFFTD